MKMDIEGSEYKVLASLLESGVFHDFDHILGEFHSKHNHIRIEGIVDLENNLSLRLQENGDPGFIQFDNEQYLNDGMEYTNPSFTKVS